MTTTPTKPIAFISYSHNDERWKDLVVRHLGVLRDQGILEIWQDRGIEAGADWHANIQEAMRAASIAVVLISSSSLTSDYILNSEVPVLFERRAAEGVRVFPVIVEPCAWQTVGWLRRMNLRPADGRPLSSGGENQINADLAALTSEIYLLLKSSAAAVSSSPQTFVPLSPDAISTARLPMTGRELFGRDLELDMLDGAWADLPTNVLSLVAWGGVGKSALVNYWLRRMARDNHRGAERVYAWSFYRQGTSEQGVSADQFIDAALRWFGDTDPTAGSPWDKGERLARLVKSQRALLLLDGLEPLQYPPGRGHQEGALKEHSMQALLRELAAYNPGLCVITTRLAIADLADYEGDTARRINLEHLSPQAGAAVLSAQGVRGTQEELERASTEFGGHALALTLLGSYLKTVYEGDVAERAKVDILREDEEQGGHALRVMASYEKWFGEGPELSVLRILGLYDRPADGPSIDALRAAPAIPGLTDYLQGVTEEDWRRTPARLRTAKLIADRDPNHPDTLDAHPLVREYFKRQLKITNPAAWREANSRLYEYLRDTTKQFPDTLDEMTPLYAAVSHGCEAGRHQEALNEIFRLRICRGGMFFSTQYLGAYSAYLTSLSGFFDSAWHKPVSELTESDAAFVLGEAGFALLSLGRLMDSTEPTQASLKMHVSHGQWKLAAISSSNLSDNYLSIGDLSKALTCARQSVEFADKSGDVFQRITKRTRMANTFHNAGRFSDAEDTFREAERMQKERGSDFPILYSLQGFQYCDLLLTQGKYQEVQTRAGQTLTWAISIGALLDIALNFLLMGRSHLLKSQREAAGTFVEATNYLNHAVNGLRQAGTQDELPRGLLARAELYRVTSEFKRAQGDLDEAMRIAARGSMGLHEADCHLEYARLYLARGEKGKARESWERARGMIDRMGYHRRDKDVREIGEMLADETGG